MDVRIKLKYSIHCHFVGVSSLLATILQYYMILMKTYRKSALFYYAYLYSYVNELKFRELRRELVRLLREVCNFESPVGPRFAWANLETPEWWERALCVALFHFLT